LNGIFKSKGNNILKSNKGCSWASPNAIKALRESSTGNTELNNLRKRFANVCSATREIGTGTDNLEANTENANKLAKAEANKLTKEEAKEEANKLAKAEAKEEANKFKRKNNFQKKEAEKMVANYKQLTNKYSEKGRGLLAKIVDKQLNLLSNVSKSNLESFLKNRNNRNKKIKKITDGEMNKEILYLGNDGNKDVKKAISNRRKYLLNKGDFNKIIMTMKTFGANNINLEKRKNELVTKLENTLRRQQKEAEKDDNQREEARIYEEALASQEKASSSRKENFNKLVNQLAKPTGTRGAIKPKGIAKAKNIYNGSVNHSEKKLSGMIHEIFANKNFITSQYAQQPVHDGRAIETFKLTNNPIFY
jgi:hypothetical protein